MPVLPEVASRMWVSLLILPGRSPASIMETPMRSLTLPRGLKNSHLARTMAPPAGTMRLILTSGRVAHGLGNVGIDTGHTTLLLT
jgi:hypothetical protein